MTTYIPLLVPEYFWSYAILKWCVGEIREKLRKKARNKQRHQTNMYKWVCQHQSSMSKMEGVKNKFEYIYSF